MGTLIVFVVGLVVGSYNALKIRAFIVSLTDRAQSLAKQDEGKASPQAEKQA